MTVPHMHVWRAHTCRCGAYRCASQNAARWRCVLHTDHDEPHRYADGTTARP